MQTWQFPFLLYTNSMPSGVTHERINFAALGLAVGTYWLLRDKHPISEPAAFCFSAGYLLGTVWITPDLDIAERKVRAKEHWGALSAIWIPYGKLFSHRGISHTWLMGPASRLAYLMVLIWIFDWLASLVLRYLNVAYDLHANLLNRISPEIVWGLLIGYFASQWTHLIFDGMWPDRRRRKRK